MNKHFNFILLKALSLLLILVFYTGCVSTRVSLPLPTNTDWELISIEYDELGSKTPSPEEKYSVTFKADGSLHGQVDCNRYMSSYTEEDGTIEIMMIASTMAACPPGSISQDYLKAFQTITGFFAGEDKLILHFSGGSLEYAPVQD
ncbi:MAG: META domain-containing protein [Spirochaetales bacterium]|nr:META domain-containing protein [Spirochaetales bacterium]